MHLRGSIIARRLAAGHPLGAQFGQPLPRVDALQQQGSCIMCGLSVSGKPYNAAGQRASTVWAWALHVDNHIDR